MVVNLIKNSSKCFAGGFGDHLVLMLTLVYKNKSCFILSFQTWPVASCLKSNIMVFMVSLFAFEDQSPVNSAGRVYVNTLMLFPVLKLRSISEQKAQSQPIAV